MKKIILITMALACLFAVKPALADEEDAIGYPHELSWHATLRTWKDRVYFQMADRMHNAELDLGTLQRFNKLMDNEYTLDLRTYWYSFQEDYYWHTKADGLRLVAGSVSKRELINYMEIKKDIPVTRDSVVRFRYFRHEDHSARRSILDLTWEDQHVLDTKWFAFWNLQPGIEKIDDDTEFGGGYRFSSEKYFKVSVVLLDAFNNFINNLITVENQSDYETKRDYTKAPIMGRAEVIWPFLDTWRVEAFGAATTRSSYDIFYQDPELELNYTQDDEMYYAGVLLEKAIRDDIVVAVYSNFERAIMHRSYEFDSQKENDVFLYETTYRGAIQAMFNPVDRHYFEAKAEYVEMPEIRNYPYDASKNVDHQDREIFASIEDYWAIKDKYKGVIGYFVLYRKSGELMDSAVNRGQHRFKMAGEYHFRERSYVSLNVNLDLDLTVISYDGGSIRLVHYW